MCGVVLKEKSTEIFKKLYTFTLLIILTSTPPALFLAKIPLDVGAMFG